MQGNQKNAKASTYLNSGDQLKKDRKLNSAIEQYQRSLQLNPNLVPTLKRLAGIYEEKKEWEQAFNCRQKIAQLQPDNPKAQASLAEVMSSQGKVDEAIATYQKALELQPKNPQFYLKQSDLYFKQNQLDQAILRAEMALQLDPNFILALNQLATLYETRKELDKAFNYYQQIVQLKPDNPNAFRQLIVIYSKILSKRNNVEEVIAAYQQVIQETKAELAEIAHREFGQLLLNISIRQGEFSQATTFFQEAINNHPNHPWFYYNLGLILFKQNQLDEAANCYQKVIKIQPELWQAYLVLGKIMKRKGEQDEAFKYCMEALQIQPNLPQRYYSWLTPRSSEQWEIYKKHLKEAVTQSNSPDPNLYMQMGRKLSQNGEFSEAISYYQQSIYYQYEKSNPGFISQYWEKGKLQNPNFLIIGVGKCGTTSLYNYLSQHPQFLPAIAKEPQYLKTLRTKLKVVEERQDWSLLDAERDFYLAHFPPRPEKNQFITGEASPSIISSRIEKIVYQWFRNIKLIAILRNPINRAISHYNYAIRSQGHSFLLSEMHSFYQVIDSELESLKGIKDFNSVIGDRSINRNSYIRIGLYIYLLERWMTLFPKEQFLILSNEDFAQNPAGVMRKTFNFLGLPEYDGINYTPRNVGSYPKDIDPDLLSRLQDFYRPHNQRLEEFLGRKFNWD